MKIATFDIATNTGWCVGDKNEVPKHGIENFSIKKSEGKGKRFLDFHIWFRHFIKKHKPDKVYFEEVSFYATKNVGDTLAGLASQAMLICEAENIPYNGVNVNMIKAYARAVGCKLEKEKLIYELTEEGLKKSKCLTMATAKQLGYKPFCDDDADAICLWHYAVGGNNHV